ncbi:hypothetical protein D9M72_546190 [compost metagenome]
MGRQHQVALGTVGGAVQESGSDLGVEFVGFGFHPVFGGVARGPAEAAEIGVDVEQHGEVRLQAGGGPFVQVPHRRGSEVPSGALIGHRGIDVTVGEDDLAALEGGEDDLVRVGRAGRGKDQGFGAGVDVAVAVVQHQGPQLFADRRAARFARAQHPESPRVKGPGQCCGLRGLACAVAAFEGNEQSGVLGSHMTSLPTITDTVGAGP